MANKVSHEHVDHIVVNLRHYTYYSYSNERFIELPAPSALGCGKLRRGYDPRHYVCWGTGPRSGHRAEFYTGCMGFKVATDRPFTETQRWIELLIPGAETGLALYTPEGHEGRIGQFQSIAFWCDDVFATCKILQSKGVAFAQEPKNEPWGSTAILKDPDGNRFALSSRSKQR